MAGETRDRIKDLIPAGELTSETRLALVNAIYFLGDWAEPFKKEATSPEAFHTSATAKHDVALMHQHLHASFADDGTVSVLDLPYADGGFAITFVLPRKIEGLAAVEAWLSAEGFGTSIAAETSTDVIVALPRFTIDPPVPMRLGTALVSLGMTDAFDRHAADFTGIANPPSPDDRLVLSKVFHKAFVKVDEKGTEAAAATAAVMVCAGAARPTEPPKQFRADHPFLFFLRDARTSTILFAGRVADPVVK